MSVIDLDKLAAPVSAETPSGPDLRFAPEYLELETAAQGKPEAQIGDIIRPAEEPNWPDVLERSVQMLGRTKDLQVAMRLILAAAKVHGIAGLADGLALLRELLERYWDTLHPQLDPEDNKDPTERLFKIAALAPGGDYADQVYLRTVREATLCHSKRLGRFGYRDILAARGDPSIKLAADQSPPDPAVIDAAFVDSDVEELKETAVQIGRSVEQLTAISNVLSNQVGAERAPNLGSFRRLLEDMSRCVSERLARRNVTIGSDGAGQVVAGPEAGPVGAAGGGLAAGQIRSRNDVLEAIDKICAFYERTEPSSPVPLLLKRAKRLVSKGFVEIIQDLTPEAMERIHMIGGIDNQPKQG